MSAAIADPRRESRYRAMSNTEWFEEGLNRGARHVPMGYVESEHRAIAAK